MGISNDHQFVAGGKGGAGGKEDVALGRSERMQQVLYDNSVKVQKPIEKQPNNTKDIEGTSPSKLTKPRQNMSTSLNANDIEGTKANTKQFHYQRKDIRNPLEPI